MIAVFLYTIYKYQNQDLEPYAIRIILRHTALAFQYRPDTLDQVRAAEVDVR